MKHQCDDMNYTEKVAYVQQRDITGWIMIDYTDCYVFVIAKKKMKSDAQRYVIYKIVVLMYYLNISTYSRVIFAT